MDKVKNPIIIDQNYCTAADPTKPKACKKQTSAVEFSNIRFKNIRGTSATKEAIKLDCSDTVPCRDVLLQDVKLIFHGGKHASATSICNNAKLTEAGSNVVPKTC
uniref:Polygalacturonase n=1 Tax=Hordeum vulgare subsp. vulgare TaxID=112509 RepID=A0A8I6WZX1_HORVV